MADSTTETGTTSTDVGTWLVDMLGDKIQGKDGKIDTSDLLKKDIISFYFSAHWCPPCRGFTPKLADTYKKVVKDGKAWEVVFVSSDKNQSAFDEYYNEMPWKALPYEKRDLKAKLSKKFKVQGIPALIMLNPRTGEIWNKEGRSAISSDPSGANFPWENRPKTFNQIMKDIKLTDEEGNKVEVSELQANVDYIAVYTSAHWCPPCRGFTPALVEWYKKFAEKNNVEFIFNSWDKTETAMKDYWKTMAWPARDFDDKASREAIDALFEIQGIPSLVVVDAKTGKLVTDKARAGVSGDPEGFPWEKKPVGKLGGDVVDALNQVPCFYAICDQKNTDAVIKACTPAAEFYMKKAIADGEWPDLMEVEFIVDNGSHALSGRVKGLLKLKDDEKLFIMDLSSKSLYNSSVKDDAGITADAVSKFLEDFRAGKCSKRELDL